MADPIAGSYFVVRTRPHRLRTRIASFLIRLGTRSEFDHAGVIVDEDGTTVEAKPSGAAIGSVHDYDGCVLLEGTGGATLTDEQRAAVVAAARSYVGRPYGFADIACLALEQYGVHLRLLHRIIGRSDRLICSQLVDQAYAAAGVHLLADGRAPQDVTPADLALLLPGVTARPTLRAQLKAAIASAERSRPQAFRFARLFVAAALASPIVGTVARGGHVTHAALVGALVGALEVSYQRFSRRLT